MHLKSVLLAISLSAMSLSFASGPTFAVVAKYKVGGDGGWDLLSVDPGAHRLYLSRGTHVMVIDEDSGRVVGDLPDTAGVHGIALASKLGKGFTSNGRDDSVTVFDLKSLRPLAKVKVGKNPDTIIYDQPLNQVITFNAGSNDVTVMDARSNAVVGTIKVGGKPEFAVADRQGSVFLNLEDTSEIEHLDIAGLKSVGKWSLAPGDEPSGLAYDSKHNLLFSTCSNNFVTVSDSLAGRVVGTVKIGNGPDAAGFDEKLGLGFSSNGGDGTLTIFGKDRSGQFAVVQTLQTQLGARTMTLDPKTHHIFLVSADFEPAPEGTRRRRAIPNSFTILVVAPTRG